MRFDVLTTFPESFDATPPALLGSSIPARARAAGKAEWHAHDIRAYTEDRHRKTDDRPYGGGPGMVMMCQPVWDAAMAAEAADPRPATRIMMSPQGEPLTQQLVRELAQLPRLVVLCGHYEGIDERVVQRWAPREISVGDYVLSGGEIACLVMMDAIIRVLPGVLGDDLSAAEDSFERAGRDDTLGRATDDKMLRNAGVQEGDRLLDCPHYTRPRVWEGMEIPDVLCSGDHAAVARWRLEQRVARTSARRPDLMGTHPEADEHPPIS